MSDNYWLVCHTKPRCEKKFAALMAAEKFEHYLALIVSIRRYALQTKKFTKPLFPGYIFIRAVPEKASKIRQNQQVARLLDPPDQAEFETQLQDILRVLEQDSEVRIAPHITEGQRVKIRSGPLRGIEGIVEVRAGQMEVILRLDFIGQAAAVRVAADEVEPI